MQARFAVVRDPVRTEVVVEHVQSPECGAVVLFTGIVRALSDDLRAVTGLHYEAHEQMAVHEFETIAREAQERFGPCNIAAVHRIGDLRIGEIAVAVAASAAHRAQAFDACEYVIGQIKERAAIWKKEFYADGASDWRENDARTPSSSH